MNNNIQFKIFKRSDKFALTPNMVIYTSLAICIATGYISDKYLEESPLEYFATILGLVTTIIGVVMLFTSITTREALRGEFCGVLELEEDSIKINYRDIMLSDIDKIDFQVSDFQDRLITTYKGDFNPKRSNGVYNYCKIRFSNGETIVIQFQQLYENDFLRTRDNLIGYHKKGKLTFMRLIHILNIEGYKNIQEFKKEIA